MDAGLIETGARPSTIVNPEARFWVAHEQIAARIRETLGAQTCVNFCAYPEDDEGLPIDNLDEVAIAGRCVLVGPQDSTNAALVAYVSQELDEPTWWEVLRQVEAMLRQSQERARIHLEGLNWLDPEHGEQVKRVEVLLVA